MAAISTTAPSKREQRLSTFDFSVFHDDKGNGQNLSILMHTWLALILDSPYDHMKPFGAVRRQYQRFHADFIGEVARLDGLAHKLVSSVVRDDFGDHKVALHRDFIKTPIFREYCLWYKSSDGKLLDWMWTFLTFGKKAPYADPTFADRALETWKATEERLSKLVIPVHVLNDLKKIVRASGLSIRADDMLFKHGPGKTSIKEVWTIPQKCENIRFSESLNRTLDFYMRGRGSNHVDQFWLPDWEEWQKGERDFDLRTPNTAVQVYVPQDYRKVRGIGKEPPSYQFFQQGVMSAMTKGIEHSRFSSLVNVTDQSKNRAQAVLASEDGYYSTLDLSRASDTVKKEIVEAIFDGDLLACLLDTRSDRVLLPDGTVVKTQKFAPMGSATCFPVECVVFAAVLVLADYLHANGISVDAYLANIWSEGNRPTVNMRPARPTTTDNWAPFDLPDGSCVYGDDIICADHQTRTVVLLLTVLGFEVNEEKSFFGARCFRESCGDFAMFGKRLKHVQFKVKGLLEWSVKRIPAMISLCNALYSAGYVCARNALKGYLPPRTYLYVENTPWSGRSPTHLLGWETNDHFNITSGKRKNKKYVPESGQTWYKVTQVVTPVTSVECWQAEGYLYASRLRTPASEDATFLYIEGQGGKPAGEETGDPVLREVWTLA